MHLTPIQQKIYDVLADGKPHKPEELLAAFTDAADEKQLLYNHLTRIRKELRRKRRDVICQFIRRSNHYRLIGLVCDKSR